jgi:hypothetical protein
MAHPDTTGASKDYCNDDDVVGDTVGTDADEV